MRVIAVHLLNDYSGSPKVLMQLVKGWTKNNIETHLFTCAGREGFLSDIPKVQNHYYWYQFASNPFVRLIFLTVSQILLGYKLLLFLKKEDVVYINTVLPFGAGIVGKLKGCKVIYHIHETSIKPKLLKQFLFSIVRLVATQVVYVSNFLAQQEPMNNKKTVLYNVLENDFITQAQQHLDHKKNEKIVLMICSLKAYKGVNEFLKLAQLNPEFTFKLVVNANANDIANYFKNQEIPSNLQIYPTQKNTHSFYKEASILLNLSDTNLWVETFGLTILEGMAYGLPAIVPPVGGVTELVKENENGYLIDSKNSHSIAEHIHKLLNDTDLYASMRANALEKSKLFNENYFEEASLKILSNS